MVALANVGLKMPLLIFSEERLSLFEVAEGSTVMVNETGAPLHPLPPEVKLPNATGPEPTVTVADTLLVAVLTTDTLFVPWFDTYTFLPSGLTDIPVGPGPVVTVSMRAFVVVLMTDMLLESGFATYKRLPSGLTVTP